MLAALVLVITAVADGALTSRASLSTATPTIRSDKEDYTPGETVTLSGSNWQPGETVHILVNDDKGQSWSRNVDVVAGHDGTIEDRFQLPDWFIAAYTVTATGPVSGTATTTFTDGNVKFDVAPSGVETAFVETLYAAATDCTGAAKSGFPKTLTNSDGDTVGVGNNESLRLDAAATSDDGRPFVAWSSTDSPASPFSVITGTGGRSICIPGFQTGTRNYRATYGAAPAANATPTVAANNASVTVNEGQTAANSGTYSDTNAGDTVAISASVGTVTKTGTNSGTWSWSYATTDGPDNSQTVTITANDGNGGVATTTFGLTVNNVAPTVGLSGAATADEGESKTYTFTVSDPGADTFSASAGFPDCGTGGGLVGGSLSTNAGGGSFQCSFPEGPATPTVRMQVADSDTAASNVATVGVTVANVAPSGTFGNTGPVNEGTSFQLSLTSVTDPSAVDTAAGFSYAFDCGDGGGYSAYGAANTRACPTSDNGTRSVRAKVKDEDNGEREYSDTVAVNNVAPTITAVTNNGPVNEGASATITVTATDPAGANDPLAYEFDCGNDGTYEIGPQAGSSASCSFGDDGSRSVNVRVTDGDGGAATGSTTVTINNLAPTITSVTNDGPTNEGSSATITVAATDPAGANDPLSYEFDCGNDGTYEVGPQAANSTSCSFDDNGARVVKVRVGDGDGGVATGSTTVTVNNVDPTAKFTNTGPVDEGKNFVLTLDDADDASTADEAAGFAFAFDCGDGSGYGPFSSPPAQSGSRTCPTSDNGTRSVKGKIRDKDGGVSEYTDTVTVDNVAPTITSVTNNGPIDEGSSATISVTATDPAGANDPLAHEFDCGNDGTYEVGPQAGASTSCSFADDGAYHVNVRVTDGDGGAATGSTTVTVANKPPVLSGQAAQSSDEGENHNFDLGSFSDPGVNDSPWKVHVDWGDSSSSNLADETSQGSLGNASHTYADNGVYTVTVKVTDKDNGVGTATFTATVANKPPVLSGQAAQSSDEGENHNFDLGSFSDPGVNDSPWKVHVDWGDSSSSNLADETSQGSLGNASHTYADNGVYTVTVKVTDKDNGVGTATFTATVANKPPVLTPPSDDNGVEGTSKSFGLGSFTDPGASDNPWSLHVTWGDGSPATNLTYSSRGALGMAPHAYDDNGVYTVTETITDKDGGSDTQTFKVTVANANPTATLGNDGPINEGGSATVTFSGQHDPSGADTTAGFHYAYACDNGSLAGATYASAGTAASHQCAFADNGNHPVKGRIIDKDGGYTEYTTTVVVNNLPPTVTGAADQTASEGATTSFDLGSFSDPGPDAPWSVNVNWGDSSSATTFNAAAPGSLGSANHKYADNGEYTVSVKVTDKDGGHGTATFKVTVSNVKPTITSFAGTGSLSGPLVFAPSTFTGTFTDPGLVDNPWVVSWTWDGVPDPTTQSVGANGTNTHSFGPTTHTFSSAGCSHSAAVKVTDKDGAFDTASTTVQVGTGGFLPPMTNQPVTDKLRNGQVLPVKVEIKDCTGQPVTNLQPVIQLKRGDLTQTLADDSLVTITPESVSAADTNGVMRAVDGHYQYNMRVSVPAADVNAMDYTVMIYPYGLGNSSQTLRHVIRATK